MPQKTVRELLDWCSISPDVLCPPPDDLNLQTAWMTWDNPRGMLWLLRDMVNQPGWATSKEIVELAIELSRHVHEESKLPVCNHIYENDIRHHDDAVNLAANLCFEAACVQGELAEKQTMDAGGSRQDIESARYWSFREYRKELCNVIRSRVDLTHAEY